MYRRPLPATNLPFLTTVMWDGRERIKCNSTGSTVQTTDPGRAMVTGKCADVGKTKGPVLRALAARAPYFHNGSAATLMDAVEFYDQRFNLNMTPQQKSDLVAFLQTL